MVMRLVNPLANFQAILEVIFILRRHARLIFEMSRDNLTGRYKGQFFGGIWVIIHPLALTMLYLFLFGVVFAQKIGGTRELPLDYTVYILSGLIPWLTFQNCMVTSVAAITGNAPLVKQFIFPLEVLPLRDVAVALITWVVMLVVTLLYTVAALRLVMVTWLLLPVVLAIHIMAMVGVAFILSAVAVFFRDIKDFVQLFCLIAIFILPVVFLPGWVPKVFQPILWINPFTYMIWVYQDVLYFGRFEHPVAWVVFLGWSMIAFAVGFRLFRSTKPMFGSLV